MFNFEIGQQVVCVRDDWMPSHGYLPPNLPVKDQVYTIRGMFEAPWMFEQELWLLFEELYNPSWYPPAMSMSGEPGFCSDRFRPVRKTSIEDLKKLCVDPPKSPVKRRAREDA